MGLPVPLDGVPYGHCLFLSFSNGIIFELIKMRVSLFTMGKYGRNSQAICVEAPREIKMFSPKTEVIRGSQWMA